MAHHLTAQELNKAICKKYGFKRFNCLVALFGAYVTGQAYLITVTQEKLDRLRELQGDYFASYVEDSCKIYEYLLSIGYEGDVYIK